MKIRGGGDNSKSYKAVFKPLFFPSNSSKNTPKPPPQEHTMPSPLHARLWQGGCGCGSWPCPRVLWSGRLWRERGLRRRRWLLRVIWSIRRLLRSERQRAIDHPEWPTAFGFELLHEARPPCGQYGGVHRVGGEIERLSRVAQ